MCRCHLDPDALRRDREFPDREIPGQGFVEWGSLSRVLFLGPTLRQFCGAQGHLQARGILQPVSHNSIGGHGVDGGHGVGIHGTVLGGNLVLQQVGAR